MVEAVEKRITALKGQGLSEYHFFLGVFNLMACSFLCGGWP